ncbi:MAG: T9SS type A sorting domain-containing protein [Bacteroidetes bacterium]|nr:T9SS type A sorting domain-containing protein [Bacteroidota bacterium]
MKYIQFVFLFLLFAFGCNVVFSQSLFNEMVKVNKFWEGRDSVVSDLPTEYTFQTDRERIQTHLNLVIENLKSHSPEGFSDEARKQRNDLLKELSVYAANGVFPMNTGHKERTPYFIDHRGVACAVGYMIIQSGFNDLAEQIHRENNYGYLMDLAVLYPQMRSWAKDHGFTLEELAWIQPSYPFKPNICDSVCLEGHFYAEYNGDIVRNYTAWYREDSTFIGYSDLNPKVCSGESIYAKVIFYDSGDTIPDSLVALWGGLDYIDGNVLTLPKTKPLKYDVKINPDMGNCTGSVLVNSVNEFGIRSWNLRNLENRKYYAPNNVCHSTYELSVLDERECRYVDTITVDSSYIHPKAYLIAQSPGEMKINLDGDYWKAPSVQLIDLSGTAQSSTLSESQVNEFVFQNLKSGIYVLTILEGDKKVQKRIFVY